MKGALIVIGTFFRDGIYLENKKETPESFHNQKKATESHLRFVNHFNTDLYIYTYPSKWENDIKNWYNTENYHVTTKNYPELRFYLNDCNLNEIKHKYDYLFIIRSDMFLKDHLFEIFNPNWKRIMMASICFAASIQGSISNCHMLVAGPDNQIEPRVNDSMLFIPKNYMYINEYQHDTHASWIKYKYTFNLKDNDMGFILNTYHDADSHKDFNPLYYFVGRKEKLYVVSGDMKIPAYYQLNPDNNADMNKRLEPTNIVTKIGPW